MNKPRRLAPLPLLPFLLLALLWQTAAWAIPPIQHWQTGKGAQVYFVENHDLPMIDLSIDFPAGSAYDTAASAGVASMTNHIMRLAAEGMDEEEIARRTAAIGVGVAGRFDSDLGGLYLRTLSSRAERDEALDIFTRVLHKPLFPAPILEREKARLISALKEADIQPATIASRTFDRLVFGDHPYALRGSGEADTVAKITRDDLVNFYRGHYAARDAVIAIMGDLTRDEATALAERLASGLPAPTGESPRLPPMRTPAQAALRLIPHYATQSHILVGTAGISRTDPDYFTLFVGNQILGGGGFASRITEEVRQKRGLAYSAYSFFIPRMERGSFTIGLQTRKDQAREALAVTMDTLRNFIANGPTDDELADAKKNLVGSFPLRIDSNRKIQGYLAVIGFYHLPLTYLDDFIGNVERVTAADIKHAFAAHVDPDKLVTVVVGADEGTAAAAPAAPAGAATAAPAQPPAEVSTPAPAEAR